MWQEERLQRITAMLATFQRISNERLAGDLGVSRETVRRDLLALEAEGVLKRVHGGAVAVAEDAEPPFAVRAVTHVKEKRTVARAATRLVKPGQTLFLDAGSTTALLAEALASLSGLTVVTNSIDVAARMTEPDSADRFNTVLLIGGHMGRDPQATHGAPAIAEIHRYRADLALLSPVGIDARHGATSFHPEEAEVARAMAAQAREVCILADHSKWGVVSRIQSCPPERITTVVGDARARQSPAFDAVQSAVGAVIIE